jgi:hypothetical protein
MNTIKYGAAMLFLTAQSLAITPINGGAISGGTPVTINISDGDQTDPHVSGDIAAYTDIAGSSIRYFNFATHVDAAIPTTPDVIDILSDVSGSRIAFSRIEIDRNALMVFDTSTATLTEIDPHAGTNRYITAIGGNTVAFIDFGSLGVVSPGQGDVYAYDLSTSTLQAISNDPAAEDNPNVSPDCKPCEMAGVGPSRSWPVVPTRKAIPTPTEPWSFTTRPTPLVPPDKTSTSSRSRAVQPLSWKSPATSRTRASAAA